MIRFNDQAHLDPVTIVVQHGPPIAERPSTSGAPPAPWHLCRVEPDHPVSRCMDAVFDHLRRMELDLGTGPHWNAARKHSSNPFADRPLVFDGQLGDVTLQPVDPVLHALTNLVADLAEGRETLLFRPLDSRWVIQ